MTFTLGINCSGLHSSACLVQDGRVRVAICEERLSRVKQDRSFPHRAISYCCDAVGITTADLVDVFVGWNPRFYLQRSDHTLHEAFRDRGRMGYLALNELATTIEGELAGVSQTLHRAEGDLRIHFLDHHRAHAAGAFLQSGFGRAAFMVLDGFGEHSTGLAGLAVPGELKALSESRTPHSLGSFYSTFTEFLGFPANSDEWKVMALAAYGDPARFLEDVRGLVRVRDGAVELDLGYFEHFLFFTPEYHSPKFVERFGAPRRANEELEQRHFDLVAAVQQVFEETVFELLRQLHSATGESDLVVGGGTFMNSVANGKLLDRSPFERVFVGGSPDDSGIAIGAALWGDQIGEVPAPPVPARHNSFGRGYSTEEIREFLESRKLDHHETDSPAADAAELIASGRIVGWFQGGSEFGQRALGNRSILADPTRAELRDAVNEQVKYREWFRPFGGSVLQERADECFVVPAGQEPYFMECVVQVRADWRDRLPGITHVDGGSRIQVVPSGTDASARFRELLVELDARIGVPVVLNTSFNTNGMPLVETPADAVACYFTSGLDALVIDRFVLVKR